MSPSRFSSVWAVLLTAGLAALLSASALAQSDCCVGRVGDANGIGGDEPTIGDVALMISCGFIFIAPPTPEWCYREVDVNQSGGADPTWDDITIGDISILIDYLFISGSSIGLPYCHGHSNEPHGYLYNVTDCKAWEGTASSSTTCLTYDYSSEGILSLIHVDAALNCCPMPSLTISVLGDTIFVNEADSGLCDCYCLNDIEYRVANLAAGRYRIAVLEAVYSGGGSLDFWVDLTQSPTGSFCVERLDYPWGSAPSGAVVGQSQCLSHGDGATAALSLSPDQSCVDIQYDGAGTLSLTHRNAGFNCCPETLSAQFSFDGTTITITETEAFFPGYGPCTCLCLYDLSLQITNLSPGQYRIVFVELYRSPSEPALDFTADLRQTTNTTRCVERHDYPWGIYPEVSGKK